MRNPQIFRRAFLLAAAGIVVVGAVSALRAQPLRAETKPLTFDVAESRLRTRDVAIWDAVHD